MEQARGLGVGLICGRTELAGSRWRFFGFVLRRRVGWRALALFGTRGDWQRDDVDSVSFCKVVATKIAGLQILGAPGAASSENVWT